MGFKIKKNTLAVVIFTVVATLCVVLQTPQQARASLGCLDYGMAYEDIGGYCQCMSGYVWSTDISGEPTCVSGNSECRDKYGYNSSYDSLSGSCECGYGYAFGKDSIGRTQCVSFREICKDKLGYNSKYNSLSDSCECSSGYELTQEYGGLECKSCISKYGYHSSYNYLYNKCECDDGYTLKDGECVEKQNNVYFDLNELDTDERRAIIKSEYNSKLYLIDYGTGCLSNSFSRYLGKKIVVNLGTDFDVDRDDTIVLQDHSQTCDIRSVERVYSDFTLFPEEEEQFDVGLFYKLHKNSEETTETTQKVNNAVEDAVQIPETNNEIEETVQILIEDKPVLCEEGFAHTLDGSKCVQIPPNAHAVDSKTDIWLCNEGYREVSNGCEEIEIVEEVVNEDSEEELTLMTHANEDMQKTKEDNVFTQIVNKVKSWFKGLFN